MKRFLIKHKKGFIVFLWGLVLMLALFLVPFLISFIFDGELNSRDILAFYGCFLGAAATISKRHLAGVVDT